MYSLFYCVAGGVSIRRRNWYSSGRDAFGCADPLTLSSDACRQALVSHILPGLEMEVVSELRSAARTAIIQQASDALERRLAFGPYERQELSSFEKIIKADSVLKHDQVSAQRSRGVCLRGLTRAPRIERNHNT